MLPKSRFNDPESSSILRAIREEEKSLHEKERLTFETHWTGTRSNVLPPIQTLQKKANLKEDSIYEDMAQPAVLSSERANSSQALRLGERSNSNGTAVIRKYSDGPIRYESYDHHEKNKTDQIPRNRSFDSYYKPNSETNHVLEKTRNEKHFSKSFDLKSPSHFHDDNSNFEKNRHLYDFDAYLKHALQRREDDKLFDKTSTQPENRRMERPKSAYYGRRRPKTRLENY